MIHLSTLARAALVLALCGAAACTPAAPAASPTAPPPQVAATDVPDAAFAAALSGVITKPGATQADAAKRLGVVRRQLAHAARRFELGADDRAMSSVLGALYLLREGESAGPLVDAETERAITGALARVSARGDTGRARALLSLVRDAAEKKRIRRSLPDVEAQGRDIDRWVADTRKGTALEILGDTERDAVGLALLDPSNASMDAASTAMSNTIAASIEVKINMRQTGKRPVQEDAIEATRALGTGAVGMLSLYLRAGDVTAALSKVEATSARRIIEPELYRAVQLASERNDAESWRGLMNELARSTRGVIGGEMGLEQGLAEAGFFGAMLETYRRDPTSADLALQVAQNLVQYGMSEAVPAVLAGAVSSPTDEDGQAAVLLLGQAIEADAQIGDFPAAERTIVASESYLERLAATRKESGPGDAGLRRIAGVRYLIAQVALRSGSLSRAETTLAAALKDAPTSRGYVTMAAVQLQLRKPDKALELATKAAAIAQSPIEEIEAELKVFVANREKGDTQASAKALERALTRALAARKVYMALQPRPKYEIARTELGLARVLSYFGETSGADRAFDRALEASRFDRDLMGLSALYAIGAAWQRGDVTRARQMLTRAEEHGASTEQLVYCALWVMLLERDAKVTSDGSATAILEGAMSSGSWVSNLAAWALGKIDDQKLGALALTESNRTESKFYLLMRDRVAGKATAPDKLREVAESSVIDLVEVDFARDLAAPRVAMNFPKVDVP